ncbi:uncharacterized protein LOC122626556 [Drosophila teissieri]|uniref:uncharacterized protein LOC122626556 n=1 Tax=Drosophila teissieri TaxID=7243 RepID=UPI001CBA18A6|nr:uncharacterized protein LOC122626556 [Drosophila teissieri]
MNKEASRRRHHKCTPSLRDILSNLGIHNRSDWFEYFERTRTPHTSETLTKKSERKCYSIPSERQKRPIERSQRFTTKLMEQESQKTEVPQMKSLVAQVLSKLFSLLFDQGPIEQISSLVFTIFTITKSVLRSNKMIGIKHVHDM